MDLAEIYQGFCSDVNVVLDKRSVNQYQKYYKETGSMSRVSDSHPLLCSKSYTTF